MNTNTEAELGASVGPVFQPAMNFGFDVVRIPRSYFSAVCLFDADGNFTTQLLVEEFLHFLGFTQLVTLWNVTRPSYR